MSKPIFERICAAFGEDDFKLHFATVAVRVFPVEQYPKAWRYSSNGGPPGCYMALSSALRRYGVPNSHDADGNRWVNRPFPAGRKALKGETE